MKKGDFSEAFLKQVNHRIKNNLQLVNSLLRIQARSYTNLTIEDFNKKSANRIHTIKLIHDSIYYDNIYYDKDAIENVDMSNYIKSLLSSLTEIFDHNTANINFNITTNNIVLDLKNAVPIGLIINELFLNSISHAFDENITTNKEITLILEKQDLNHKLTYTDNGIGFDKNKISKSLGLEIIDLLTQQMKAKLEEETTQGVEYKIHF